MQLALVTNVASGPRDRAGRVAELLSAAGAEVSVHAFEPGAEGALARAAADASAERPDRLAVAGGDGSTRPGAAGAAGGGRRGAPGGAARPLAVAPPGPANDFARYIALPLDLEAACRVAATAT